MFAVEHRLDLLVAEGGEDLIDIVAEAGRDADRLAVAAEGLGVEQAGIELVPIVEGHPAAVEVEARGTDVAAHQLGEEELAVLDDIAALAGEAGDIAVAMRLLRLDELVDDIVDAAAAFLVARLRVHQRQGGEIVAERVTGDGVALPAAIDFALGLQARALAIIVEQSVGLQPMEIGPVRLDRRQERRRQEPHSGKRKGLGCGGCKRRIPTRPGDGRNEGGHGSAREEGAAAGFPVDSHRDSLAGRCLWNRSSANGARSRAGAAPATSAATASPVAGARVRPRCWWPKA